jgi:hypothetical protein
MKPILSGYGDTVPNDEIKRDNDSDDNDCMDPD